jgi:Fe-S cluster assembly protein SufD
MAASNPETFAGDFARLRAHLAGAEAAWLDELRGDAISALKVAGFPGARDEDWKYTSALSILKERLEPVLPDEVRADDDALRSLLSRAPGLETASSLLVFVDGHYRASLSRPEEGKSLRAGSLRRRLQADAAALEPWLGKILPLSAHGFAALNTAFLDDGAVIEVARGAALPGPVHLVYLSTRRDGACVTHPRNVIVAREGSSATVVEHYLGEEGARGLTNAATEIVTERGANLVHVRVQDEAATAFHVARVQVEQEEGSALVSRAFAFGAALSRVEIAVRLAGERADCNLAGVYAMDGARHVDHHLSVDHARPRTTSSQLYKGILDDRSRGVFTGRVVVRSGSAKIKAVQSNPSLLLGAGAVAETRPQLEIYTDDVACNHGATIGRLDEDALFYLLSRGISPREARRLMVAGFAAETVDGVAPEALREALVAYVGRRVGALGAGGAA